MVGQGHLMLPRIKMKLEKSSQRPQMMFTMTNTIDQWKKLSREVTI